MGKPQVAKRQMLCLRTERAFATGAARAIIRIQGPGVRRRDSMGRLATTVERVLGLPARRQTVVGESRYVGSSM
jgi:hypothetical protein